MKAENDCRNEPVSLGWQALIANLALSGCIADLVRIPFSHRNLFRFFSAKTNTIDWKLQRTAQDGLNPRSNILWKFEL